MEKHHVANMEVGGSNPTTPLQFIIEEIPLKMAKELNEKWHSILPHYNTGFMPIARVCYGAMYNGKCYAVAIWNNPSSPSLPQREWLELRRMAIAPEAPHNTASRMISVMLKLIREKLPDVVKVISYQDTGVHLGTIYKASGWVAEHTSTGSKQHFTGKYRDVPTGKKNNPKIRWVKNLE